LLSRRLPALLYRLLQANTPLGNLLCLSGNRLSYRLLYRLSGNRLLYRLSPAEGYALSLSVNL
jgi:hypothetical protein